MEYSCSKPYPPVTVERKNPVYARQMESNMGGENSEMSAVGAYFYFHLVTEDLSEEVAVAFHKISIVEMHHLEIFGELTLKLGGDPRLWEYQRGRQVYWSPGYLNYPRKLRPVLQQSLIGEQNAIRKYRCQAKAIRDKNIVAQLERIIEDEEIHVKIFKDLLARC